MPDKDYQSKRDEYLRKVVRSFVSAGYQYTDENIDKTLLYLRLPAELDSLIAEERQKEREATVYELLDEFNTAGDEDLNDVRILTNSDSIHEFIASQRNQPSGTDQHGDS
jgi:hypothetical protein